MFSWCPQHPAPVATAAAATAATALKSFLFRPELRWSPPPPRPLPRLVTAAGDGVGCEMIGIWTRTTIRYAASLPHPSIISHLRPHLLSFACSDQRDG